MRDGRRQFELVEVQVFCFYIKFCYPVGGRTDRLEVSVSSFAVFRASLKRGSSGDVERTLPRAGSQGRSDRDWQRFFHLPRQAILRDDLVELPALGFVDVHHDNASFRFLSHREVVLHERAARDFQRISVASVFPPIIDEALASLVH